MAATKSTNTKNDEDYLKDKLEELELSLPKQEWLSRIFYRYQEFWCPGVFLKPLIQFQTHFEAYDTDIFVASLPKTGTTWVKSLLFSIVNRKNLSNIPMSHHPLSTKSSHMLIQNMECHVYAKTDEDQPDLTKLPSPRLLATHVPYQSLPNSIKSSSCRIVYVCRNPIDTFVSSWHFFLQLNNLSKDVKSDMETMEEHIGKFIKGVHPFGPYDEHIIGYWKESIQTPHRVLLLEYEGLKKDPKVHIERLAEFVGCPFSEEEKGSVMEDIIQLCSFKSLKEMEVNKTEMHSQFVANKALFRKGEVGDWTNDLTPSMAKRLDEILREKLTKVGFSFKYYEAKDQFLVD